MYTQALFSGTRTRERFLSRVAAPIALLATFVSLLFAMGCGSSSSTKPFPVAGSFSNASLSGQYAFVLSGTRVITTDGVQLQTNYQEAGVFSANGNGSITAGGEDVHVSGVFPGLTSAAITGTYSIGQDGNGQVTLNVAGGVETWAITMVSSSKFYLADIDASVNFSANAAGEGEQQDTTVLSSIPSGSFAFLVHQLLPAPPSSAIVGQFTAAAGSAVGQVDTLQNGSLSSSAQALSATLASLDASGRGRLIVSINGVSSSFNYYIVNATNLLLLETDDNVLGLGRAEAQSLPLSATALSGAYAFGTRGDTSNNVAGINTVGTFTVTGTSLSGTYDSNRDGTTTAQQAVTGTISTFDPTTGRAAMNLTPSGGGNPIQEVWYLVNPTRAFSLVFYPNLPATTEDGVIDQQTGNPFSNSSLKGQYAFLMDGFVTKGLLTQVGTFIPDGNGNLNVNQSTNLYTTPPVIGSASATVTQPVYVKGATYMVSSGGRTTANTSDLVLYIVSPAKAYVLQGAVGLQMFGPLEVQH